MHACTNALRTMLTKPIRLETQNNNREKKYLPLCTSLARSPSEELLSSMLPEWLGQMGTCALGHFVLRHNWTCSLVRNNSQASLRFRVRRTTHNRRKAIAFTVQHAPPKPPSKCSTRCRSSVAATEKICFQNARRVLETQRSPSTATIRLS